MIPPAYDVAALLITQNIPPAYDVAALLITQNYLQYVKKRNNNTVLFTQPMMFVLEHYESQA